MTKKAAGPPASTGGPSHFLVCSRNRRGGTARMPSTNYSDIWKRYCSEREYSGGDHVSGNQDRDGGHAPGIPEISWLTISRVVRAEITSGRGGDVVPISGQWPPRS